MSTAANKVGKKIIATLSNRKGFDWWFEALDASLKREITNEVGKAALAAVKEA